MENRGQKRSEEVDELPADKRACSSLEFKPSASNPTTQTDSNFTNSTPETVDAEMDTSSSASGSSRSDGDHDDKEDSAYGSCDSDDDDGEPRHRTLRDFQRQRSTSDHGKLKGILPKLGDEAGGPTGQLVALSELCEVLSFSTEDSLTSLMADMLSPVLVKLTKIENNVDIMLLSIRAITYLCDVFPRSSAFLVKHDAVSALCQILLNIQYMDVAEQCLQALEKISKDQPAACLQAGAIMASLNFIDFFSTSIQRVALSTVVNICKKLPSESPSPFMEAVPILCNLLQYEDPQLVESVAICLIRITERVSHSSEMLDELCRHGLINQATHLLNLNSRTTLSQWVYNGLIGLLAKLSSGSIVAIRTLYELNISSILKDILSTYELSHGISTPQMIDGHCNQIHEVLKLLNELLPTTTRDQVVNGQPGLDKETFFANDPDILHQFGMDILPMMVQIVNYGANLYVCYGCLSVIHRLVYFEKSDMLCELLKTVNISSFLAGVFTRKDHHVLVVALLISDMILQKVSDAFFNSFLKEGVFFAIDAFIEPEKSSHLISPVFSGIHVSLDSGQKSSIREARRCLCYAFYNVQSTASSEVRNCKLDKDAVKTLAEQLKTRYFATEIHDTDKGLTDILQNLKNVSTALEELTGISIDHDTKVQHEENFYCILHQIMAKLNGDEPVSTFEFIESGIVKSLMKYLSNGLYMGENVKHHDLCSQLCVVGERFGVLARLFLSSSDFPGKDSTSSVLIQKLQCALSSMENFPVILSPTLKQKNSYSVVPNRRCNTYPCLRVRFVREEGETNLSDYSKDFTSVDPFSSLDMIEEFLWPRVKRKVTGQIESNPKMMDHMENQHPHLLSNSNCSQGESSGHMVTGSGSTDMPNTDMPDTDMQEDKVELQQSGSGDAKNAPPEQLKISTSAICKKEDNSPRLFFYLDGHQLERSMTLYQAIIQQQLKFEHEMITGEKLWSQSYKVTYKSATEFRKPQGCSCSAQSSSVSDNVEFYMQHSSLLSSIFSCRLGSDLDKSNPTYDILFLLKSLERLNRISLHLISHERIRAFAEGKLDKLDNLMVVVHEVMQNDFVSSKLTEKLEQQMRDSCAVSIGGMPSWCNQLMASCSFLFSFEARCKYFRLVAFGPWQVQSHHHQLFSHNNSSSLSEGRQMANSLPRKKFLVCRDKILESAAQMMDLHARHKVLLEVEYDEEVGTGLGPTLEFYTLVSHEYQKCGLGMWRGDHSSFTTRAGRNFTVVKFPSGLFPRPWSTSDGMQFSEVLKKFVLLGQIVAKALQDGRVLDLPFSKAFYKLMLGEDISLYDIQSFDPELGRTLLEFQALVQRRKKILESTCGESSMLSLDLCFRDSKIEDLCLDFTVPGYPECVLSGDHNMVNMNNLEDYISGVVDATIRTGIIKQVEAFKSGFNQIFSIEHLQTFNEEELEHLLCGERDFWTSCEVSEHIKFDHGYTASSPPVINLLEILQEFDYEQRRAFLQFVTGAPRLPIGGLASLRPKLTIVRKHCNNSVDADLPSVMTCANYLKLPPYSSKERMKEKILYATTEGQGSFHLS